MQSMKRKNVVTIGGGTGNFVVLTSLKQYPINLSAIVTMTDDGGSSGILRDELGVLPPGDIRQCLVALSASEMWMRELMNYRFANGGLQGHSMGNLLLSALEKMSGSFDAAVERASEILRIEGKVIPATLDKVRLVAYLKNGNVLHGEHTITKSARMQDLKKIVVQPHAKANPKALEAIRHADFIVIGPGDFYASLIPNFLISGVSEGIRKSSAKKIYICNLMSKRGHTEGFSVFDFVRVIESYIGTKFDYVVYNNKSPLPSLLKKYARLGESFIPLGTFNTIDKGNRNFVGSDLINKVIPKQHKGDPLKRSLIRHNPSKLGTLLASIILGTQRRT